MQVPTATIKAAICCAGTKDVRYYLNGALFEYKVDTLTVVSTDGHILSKFTHTFPEIDNGAAFEIIIPLETLKTALKLVGKMPTVNLELTDSATWMLGAIAFTPIDGKFLDYRRVIPNDRTIGAPGQFDADLLIRARAALRAFDNSPKAEYFLQHRGKDGAIMRNDGDAIVVVMGLNVKPENMRGIVL